MHISESTPRSKDHSMAETELLKPMNIEEAMSQLLKLPGKFIRLKKVLAKVSPDHAHWKEEISFSPFLSFDPGPRLYRYLLTVGLRHFLQQNYLLTKQFLPKKLLGGCTKDTLLTTELLQI